MKKIYCYDFKFCKLGIEENIFDDITEDNIKGAAKSAICRIIFSGSLVSILEKEEAAFRETTLIKKAAAQITEYLDGKRRTFDLPLAPHGTDFQLNVWNTLQKIPYGETRSYKQIAEAIGNPKAVRAVGMANNRNPIPIIIPCHRVIGADNSLTGYAGGLGLKQKLLELENSSFGRYG